MDWTEFITGFVEYLSHEAAAGVGVALGALAVFLATKVYSIYKDKIHKKQSSVQRLNNVDIEVYKLLSELAAKTDADRAYVCLFHNGIFYINNSSQMKLTCTHETVKSGVSHEANEIQSKLISSCPSAINRIINQVCPEFLPTTQSGKQDSYLARRGTTYCVINVMRKGDIVEGFVAIDYVNELSAANIQGDSLLKEEIKNYVREYSDKIGYCMRSGK